MRNLQAGFFLLWSVVAVLILVNPWLNAAEIPATRQPHQRHGLQVQKSATDVLWTKQEAGTKAALWSVKAVSAQVAWASGDSGIVLRTLDGGVTWKKAQKLRNETVYSVEPLDSMIAIITTTPPGSGQTSMFRTTDGGSTWDTVYALQGSFINVIHMFTREFGLAVGDPVGGKWAILHTGNGGATWDLDKAGLQQSGHELGVVNSFAAVGERFLAFGTDGGGVYRTTDGGNTWERSQTSQSTASSLSFADTLHGVAAGYNLPYLPPGFSVSCTSDGGTTWQSYNSGVFGSLLVNPLASVGGSDFWGGMGNEIFRSTDFGHTWHTEFSAPSNNGFLAFSMVPDGAGAVGWIVNTGGEIYKGVASTLTDASLAPLPLPEIATLEQNFPNPFNPSTTIRYAVPHRSRVELSMFNTLGQQVATLVSGDVEAGYHEVQFNASGLASGVYFYRLQTGNFTATKTLILLK